MGNSDRSDDRKELDKEEKGNVCANWNMCVER